MDYKLEGKLAFVTGSTKGIGKAAAVPQHREGRSTRAIEGKPGGARKLAL